MCDVPRMILLLLLLLYNLDVCHKPFLSGTSFKPAVIPTAHASSFTLQYFPYYVWCSKYIIIIIIIIIIHYAGYTARSLKCGEFLD